MKAIDHAVTFGWKFLTVVIPYLPHGIFETTIMQIRFFELETKKTYVPITPDRDRFGRVLPRAISRRVYETFCTVVATLQKCRLSNLFACAQQTLDQLRDGGKQRVGEIVSAYKRADPKCGLACYTRQQVWRALTTLSDMGLVYKCDDGLWCITPAGYALAMENPNSPANITLVKGVLNFDEADKPAIERILWVCERWENDRSSRALPPLESLLRTILIESGFLSTNETIAELERDRRGRTDPNAQICRILKRPFAGIRRADAGERVFAKGRIMTAKGGELTHAFCLDEDRFLLLLSLPESMRYWSVPLFESLTTTKSLA